MAVSIQDNFYGRMGGHKCDTGQQRVGCPQVGKYRVDHRLRHNHVHIRQRLLRVLRPHSFGQLLVVLRFFCRQLPHASCSQGLRVHFLLQFPNAGLVLRPYFLSDAFHHQVKRFVKFVGVAILNRFLQLCSDFLAIQNVIRSHDDFISLQKVLKLDFFQPRAPGFPPGRLTVVAVPPDSFVP